MLQLIIPETELWDEEKEEFITIKRQKILLEHSLVSLSKWESKWCIPFISKQEKTRSEIIDYIRCMTLTRNVDDNVYTYMTPQNINKVNEYIDAPMTATWFSDDKKKKNAKSNSKPVTAELIYYWMIALNIPFECQKWHLNRLLTLIRVCNEENKPPKKMSTKEIMDRNAALNAARRQKLHSKG